MLITNSRLQLSFFFLNFPFPPPPFPKSQMIMKAVYLFLYTWVLINTTAAQSLEWVTTIGDVSNDQGQSVVTDHLGNLYATGTFRGKVDVDPGPDSFFLTSIPDIPTVYVIKLTKLHQLVWAKALGAGAGLEITLDYDGMVDVAGSFVGSSDFDPGPGIKTLTSNGVDDIFICQLSANGVFQWAVGFGGPEQDHVSSIAIDTSNNIYTTGYFRNTMDIDPGIAVQMMTAAGETDVFIQKLSYTGVHQWSRQFGDIWFDNGAAICVSTTGNIILTGNFHGIVDFDPGSGVHNLIADDSLDVFVCSLTGAGFYSWAENFGGVDDVIASDVVLDHQDNILITGYFKNTADFNPAVLEYAHLTSLGGTDIFLSKLDTNGNFIWVKQLGGSGPLDQTEAIVLDQEDNIYLAGHFLGVCDVDPGPGVYNLISPSSIDMFLVKLDSTAHLLSAHPLGGPASDFAYDVAVDDEHRAYVTGFFTDSADFSPGRETVIIPSHGGQDAFVVRLNFLPYISDLQGPVSPCAGGPATYSISAENVTLFSWTFPANWTVIGSSNNDTVTVLTNGMGGAISVYATGENGTTFPQLMSVYPVTTPGLSNLIGVFIPCPGEIKTYRVHSTNLDSISWSFPAGWQIIGDAHLDSVKVKAGITGGVLTVTGFNACGDTSLQRNLIPQKLPVISNLIGDLTPCIGDTLIYRVQQTAVQHYGWSFPAGWTLLSQLDSIAARVIIGSPSGQVTIKGTNNCGDTTFTTGINPVVVPDASISVNINTLTIQPLAQSYQWYLNSFPIPGATQNSYTAAQNGLYFARVTFSSGCIVYTNTVTIIISGLQNEAEENVYIYPIPAEQMIHVAGIGTDFHFDLYDLTGRIINKDQSSEGVIDISQVMPGTYFLRIKKDKQEYTFLFIKK